MYSISLKKFEQLNFNNLKNLSLRGNLDFLNLFFKTIDPDLVHINSFAGLDWYYHQKLLTYFLSSKLKYKFVIHDYACMSNDYTLLSPEYIYEKEPSLEKRNIWNNFKTPRSNLNMTDVFERHAAYANFFHNCSIIEAPSKRARDIILSDFPDLDINVVPHDTLVKNILPAKRSKEIGKIKIATIGAIGLAKGSQLLSALALDSQTRDLNLTYFVVGYVNAALKQDMKKNGISISGKFQNENECINILREISPDIVLLPSICEETFCYTLSIVLTLKIPTIVFDIGAQSERTQEFDWVIRLNPSLMSNPRAISDLISKLDIDDLWEKANS